MIRAGPIAGAIIGILFLGLAIFVVNKYRSAEPQPPDHEKQATSDTLKTSPPAHPERPNNATQMESGPIIVNRVDNTNQSDELSEPNEDDPASFPREPIPSIIIPPVPRFLIRPSGSRPTSAGSSRPGSRSSRGRFFFPVVHEAASAPNIRPHYHLRRTTSFSKIHPPVSYKRHAKSIHKNTMRRHSFSNNESTTRQSRTMVQSRRSLNHVHGECSDSEILDTDSSDDSNPVDRM
ncbi:hypothetical protein D9757_005079 [Collybiopsis confluens]|uniref:Uncharacterized protein n=1 Tax=Collybiopsis confluens TaxID=2823264 RepID=A0A8H5HTC8_9AGAR|nr:hypothetical protein D9757_005079 [Collybiopsis confluens]